MSQDALVFDVTAATFEAEVLEQSSSVPVLVDFWAAWCGPCRALAPVLEAVVDSYQGGLKLAKVDTEAERELAAAHGIRSLPTVRLYRDGEVVAEFMGALPESQVRAAIEPHLPRASDGAMADGLALANAGRFDEALTVLEAAFAEDPDNARLVESLLHTTVSAGVLDRAEELIGSLAPAVRQADWVRTLEARMMFARVAAGAAPEPDLRARLEADPADLEARYQLGARFVAIGQLEEAMDEFLSLMKRSRSYGDDAARKGLVALFDMLGEGNPLVGRYRQLMASALY